MALLVKLQSFISSYRIEFMYFTITELFYIYITGIDSI